MTPRRKRWDLEYESHQAAPLAKLWLLSGKIQVWGCDIIVDWADPIKEPDSDTMTVVYALEIKDKNFHN